MQPNCDKIYSWPMLGKNSNSYKCSSFTTALEVDKDMHYLKIAMHAKLENMELEKLVETGAAAFVCHVECAKTIFRRAYLTNKADDVFYIDDSKLNGNMEISTYLVMTKDVANFMSDDLVDVYSKKGFFLQRALVIGIGSYASFYVQSDAGDFSDSPSIFSIVLDTNKRHLSAHVELTDSKIQICLPEKAYNNYKIAARDPRLLESLHGMLLIPALEKAIRELQDQEGMTAYQDARWCKSLAAACQRGGKQLADFVQSSDPFVAAQELLDNPIVKGLEKLAVGGDIDED